MTPAQQQELARIKQQAEDIQAKLKAYQAQQSSSATPSGAQRQAVTPVVPVAPRTPTGNAISTGPTNQSNATAASGVSQPSPGEAQKIQELQAYKKQLEEKLRGLQAQKQAQEQQKSDELKRQEAARLNEQRLAEQRKQEQLPKLQRELEAKQKQHGNARGAESVPAIRDPKNIKRLEPPTKESAEKQTTTYQSLEAKWATIPRSNQTFETPKINSDPTIARTDDERRQQAAAYVRAQETRNRLWQQKDIGSGVTAAGLNNERLKQDWETLHLAKAAYNDHLAVGGAVFKDRTDWIVIDRKTNPETGFLAYTFLNKSEGRVVMSVQGSRPPAEFLKHPGDFVKDWGQDLSAMYGGKKPAQFDDAAAHLGAVKEKYGARFVVDCTGHSMGGGACAYAASNVGGVHAAPLDPITYNQISSKNAYLIDNYVMAGEVADNANRQHGRSSPGTYYEIGRSNLRAPIFAADAVAPLDRHGVGELLDGLAKESGLPRLELAQP